MGRLVEHIWGTDAQILALTSSDLGWYERGFYYPTDKSYFYQVINGVMTRKGDGSSSVEYMGTGILLNDVVLGGVKNVIEADDVLLIPENYEYNVYRQLTIQGQVDCRGEINFIQ